MNPPNTPLNVFLAAGEESGDRLGAALMRALGAVGGPVRFAGVGGTQMGEAGLGSLFPLSDLSLMGFGGVLRRLPSILRRIRQTAEAVVEQRPDVLVIIDSPEFTHRVAKRVRAMAPTIPIVDYVSPSVWAWRPWRARAMRRYVDHVLAVLPFEPSVHRELGGPPCTYVGHPVCERLSFLRPDVAGAAERGGGEAPLLLVLPGSRGGEVSRLLEPFQAAVEHLAAKTGPLDIVVPTVPHLHARIREAVAGWAVPARVIVDQDEKDAAFRRAHAALAASGTVTLELAMAGIPTVAAYRVSRFDAFLARRLIRVDTAILPNLILNERVVPEFIQEACTAEALADALAGIMTEGPERRRQIEAFSRLDAVMEATAAPPSVRAAKIVFEIARATHPVS